MIRELSVYRCICSKCKGTWITKDHALPVRCAKCNVKTWNDDFDFGAAQIEAPALRSENVQTPQIIETTDDKQTKLERARAALMSVESRISAPVIEEQHEWIGWSKEEQTYDDQTGDMRTYRKHIKTGKVRWIDSEIALISV